MRAKQEERRNRYQRLVRRRRRREWIHRRATRFARRSVRRILRRSSNPQGHNHGIRARRQPVAEQSDGSRCSRRDISFSVDVSNRHLAAQPEPDVRRQQCDLPIRRRRSNLQGDQSRSHSPRSADAWRFGRPNHQGSDLRGVLRDRVYDRRVTASRWSDLGRNGRRTRADYPRRRQDVEERDSRRIAGVGSHLDD